jgi:hypothetical protein
VDADRETVRGELRAAFVADCRAGTRAYHECGLAAKSVGELVACRDRQRTPSSSTSKRSVELGGMTLPKPRAP